MTTSAELREISAAHGLTWPEEYLTLADDGMVDMSPTGDEVPLLHFSTSFELLGAKDIARRLEMFAEPDDFRNIDPAEGLLPFGMEPGGNLYCFRTGAAGAGPVPVVLLQNDEQEDERLAPDLAGFIFAEMVVASAEFYDDDYLGEGEPRRNAEAWLQSHEPYLGQEQAAALRELFARPLIVRDDDSMGFLEFSEVDELVDPVLRYPERYEPIQLWERG